MFKSLRFILKFLIIIFFNKNLYAQDLISIKEIIKKSDIALANLKHVNYEIERKDLDINNEIAHITQAKVTLSKVKSKDLDYKFNITYFDINNEIIENVKYDSNYILFDRPNKGIFYQDINIENGWLNQHRKMIPDIFNNGKDNKNYFSKYYSILGSLIIKKQSLSDTTINSESCYKIKFVLKNFGDLKNVVRNYFIRKKDFLPVGYYESFTVMGVFKHSEYYIKYLKFPEQIYDNFYHIDLQNYPNIRNIQETYTSNVTRKRIQINEKAPNFSAQLTNDSIFNLANYKGKVVILDFWYLSCFPCLKAIPKINELAIEYKNKDVVFIGINRINPKNVINNYFNKNNIVYNSTYQSLEIDELFGVNEHPTVLIIDKFGNVKYIETGYSNNIKKTIKSTIDKLLN